MAPRGGPGGGGTAAPGERTLDDLLARLHGRFPRLRAEAVRSGLAAAESATWILAALDAHFGRYGLSQIRFTILMILYHLDDRMWTPAVLADTLRVRRPTLTGVLRVLERDGWIDRRPDPDDGRRTLVGMTRSGRDRFPRIMDDHFKRVVTAFADVSEHDYETFVGELEKMRGAFEALSADAAASPRLLGPQ